MTTQTTVRNIRQTQVLQEVSSYTQTKISRCANSTQEIILQISEQVSSNRFYFRQ